MKKFQNENVWRVLSFLLFVLAVVSGGGAMAADPVVNDAPIGDEGPTPKATADPGDPADPNENDLHVPGDKNVGETVNGTQMSTSQQRQEGNIDDEWDRGITTFQPWDTPLYSLSRKMARTVNIQNWSVKHARMGGDTLDGRTIQEIPAADQIQISAANFKGSIQSFYKGTTIFAPMVAGYKHDSSTEKENCLQLFVVDYDATNKVATCVATNGPLKEGESPEGGYDARSCPAIPAGTYLCAGSSIASESQLLITPENFNPRYEEFFVQKRLLNIVWTMDYEKAKKKIPWRVKDVKANALRNFKRRAERSYWLGTNTRIQLINGDQSVEDGFSMKGVLWQVTNAYSVERGHVMLADLIAMSKLQHTTFSQNDHSFGFCGSTFMQWLLNLDMGENKRIVKMEDVRELDIDFKRLKTTFGTTDFTYDQGLDAIGMDECCVILDLQGATRYVKIGEKEQTNDMSKGAGEIRDAKRTIWREADCLALRGYNSIIVGPSDIIFGLPESDSRTNIVSSAMLPDEPAEGTIVALTADYVIEGGEGKEDKKYEANSVWQYTKGEWVEYTGYTTAV